MDLATRDAAARILPALLLEEHLLSIGELEVCVALLAGDHLGRNDLLLGSSAVMAERRRIIALLYIMHLRTDAEVEVL